MSATTTVVRVLKPPPRYHLAGSVFSLVATKGDPCARMEDGGLRLAARTPEGAGSLHLDRCAGELLATAYGPGAGWLADRADAFAGLRDDIAGFAALAAPNPLVARLAKTFAGHLMPTSGLLFHRALRAVLEQKVTGKEAHHSYRRIVKHFGEPAPGPAGLTLPPEPAAIAATPYWVFHPFGVEQRRTQALLRVAQVADRLGACADSAEATRRLTAIPGIGVWTAAEVVRTTYGDADAVSVGDFHIKNTVSWALAGEPRGDDARMLQLLEPFRGHRARVCDLLAAGGIGAPKYGPRMAVRSFARF